MQEIVRAWRRLTLGLGIEYLIIIIIGLESVSASEDVIRDLLSPGPWRACSQGFQHTMASGPHKEFSVTVFQMQT